VYQEAIDVSIEKLNQGQWIHMYPEGYVNQKKNLWPLRRFKWGIARMLMETKVTPTVIPMYITGFDRIMPEGRPIPAKFMPLTGQDLTVTFGTPDLITRHVKSELARWRVEEASLSRLPEVLAQSRTAQTRSRLTAIVQEDLEQLGTVVGGHGTRCRVICPDKVAGHGTTCPDTKDTLSRHLSP